MSQENVKIVRRIFEARNRGDWTAVRQYAAPDIEFDFSTSSGPWAGGYRGFEAIMEPRDSGSKVVDQFSWEAEELIDAGDAVVVDARYSSRGRGSGVETVSRRAQVYWLVDGKVVRYHQCQSREQALEAVGLAG